MKIAPDGEILVRGENVTTGYFNAADETARAFEDGWFHTGDVGEIGPDGQLFIRGRKKEMIVTPEGLNVFPEDVERVLNHVPGVRDSAVVGVASGRTGTRPRGARARAAASSRMPSCARRTLQLEEHQKIRRARRVAGGRAAANRRHQKAEAGGDSRVGAERRAGARRREQARTG